MNDDHGIPIECAARLDFIIQRAADLETTFDNGNRRDLVEGLLDLPPKVAFAVLATICERGGERVASYLRAAAQAQAGAVA